MRTLKVKVTANDKGILSTQSQSDGFSQLEIVGILNIIINGILTNLFKTTVINDKGKSAKKPTGTAKRAKGSGGKKSAKPDFPPCRE